MTACTLYAGYRKTKTTGTYFSGTIPGERVETRNIKVVNAFMQEAIREATENVRLGRGGPFAAVVVKDGRVIAAGANSVTSTNDPTAQAEVNAIR